MVFIHHGLYCHSNLSTIYSFMHLDTLAFYSPFSVEGIVLAGLPTTGADQNIKPTVFRSILSMFSKHIDTIKATLYITNKSCSHPLCHPGKKKKKRNDLILHAHSMPHSFHQPEYRLRSLTEFLCGKGNKYNNCLLQFSLGSVLHRLQETQTSRL